MKDTVVILLGLAAIVGAGYLYARQRQAGSAPPPDMLYHPVNNPNGYSAFPTAGGGTMWSKVTPEGQPVYWADVL